MEKNDITPMGCNNCLVYEEFNKEDLKEAGVVLEYTNHVTKEQNYNGKKETRKRKDWLRYLMFLFLVLSFLLLIFVGSLRISSYENEIEKSTEYSDFTSLIMKKVVNG